MCGLNIFFARKLQRRLMRRFISWVFPILVTLRVIDDLVGKVLAYLHGEENAWKERLK